MKRKPLEKMTMKELDREWTEYLLRSLKNRQKNNEEIAKCHQEDHGQEAARRKSQQKKSAGQSQFKFRRGC